MNTPTNNPLTQASVSTIDPIADILDIINATEYTTAVLREDKAIIITMSDEVLDKLASSSEEFGQEIMRNMLYPFQTLNRLTSAGTIPGFAIVPSEKRMHDPAAQLLTSNIGQILQSLCVGELSLR